MTILFELIGEILLHYFFDRIIIPLFKTMGAIITWLFVHFGKIPFRKVYKDPHNEFIGFSGLILYLLSVLLF